MEMTFNLALALFCALFGVCLAKIHGIFKDTNDESGKGSENPRLSCFICPWVDNDHGCGDRNFSLEPYEPSYYMENCRVCYKKTQFNSSGTKLAILRGCSIETWVLVPGCQYTYYEGGYYIEECACKSDYCNGGTFILPQSLAVRNANVLLSVQLIILLTLIFYSFAARW